MAATRPMNEVLIYRLRRYLRGMPDKIDEDEFINFSVTMGLNAQLIGAMNRKVFKGTMSENHPWSDSIMTDS